MATIVQNPDGTTPLAITVALPAGTNNIGDVDVLTLPALVAGTANIGDVDVLTVPAPLSTTGGGTEATALRVTVASDSTGVVSVDDNGGSLTVDGTVAVTGVATLAEQQTQTTALQLLDDTVATTAAAIPAKGLAVSGTDGTNARVLKTDTGGELQIDVLTLPALVAGTANIGDVDVLTVPAPLSTTGGGTEATALRVTVASDSTGVLSVDDNGGSLTVDGTVTASNTAGDVASDAVDSGNPVKVGALAKSADITAVADADRVNLIASLLGKPIVLPYATPALTWNYAAAAGGLVTTGGVTAKAAGTGAQRQYVTKVQAINSHQTISTEVVIRDGAAGTVLWRGWAQAAGGGCAAKFDPPLRGTAATLVEIAEITTTATAGVLVNLQGFTAAE